MPTSIFTKIIRQELPAYVVQQDNHFIAILDRQPLAKGHTLVIPKEEVDYLFDQKDYVLEKILLFSKKVAQKIEKIIPCQRVGLAVVGLEVPHAHVHLIPLQSVEDINFNRPKLSFSAEEFQALCQQLQQA